MIDTETLLAPSWANRTRYNNSSSPFFRSYIKDLLKGLLLFFTSKFYKMCFEPRPKKNASDINYWCQDHIYLSKASSELVLNYITRLIGNIYGQYDKQKLLN